MIEAPLIQRKIQCPGHFLIPPKEDVWLYEDREVPELKECSDNVEFRGKRLRIKKRRIKKDIFGRKMIDVKRLYELKKIGKVIQPWVTCRWAIEHIWDPLSYLCQHCDKRCKRGVGTIDEFSIKRLHSD